jgi:adenylyl-sulfate kinase
MSAGQVIWLTGLPAAGKTTIARLLSERMAAAGRPVEVLDGDEVRKGLSPDLGFSRQDRHEHARRIVFVAQLLVRNGIDVIVPMVSPYRETRLMARHSFDSFVEVWVRCSLEECVRRDPKGLYRRALAGEIPNMTGISDTYEEPLSPELVVDTEQLSAGRCVERILSHPRPAASGGNVRSALDFNSFRTSA